MVMYIIVMAYAMKQVIIGKHVLIDNVCMKKQIFIMIYHGIFIKHIKII